MLTTKAQKDFTLWALKQPYFKKGVPNIGIQETGSDLYLGSTPFKNLPLVAQFGIYQDYFNNQHDLFIETGHGMTINNVLYFYAEIFKKAPENIEPPLKSLFEKNFKTPDEARKTAIQEAFKLIEERL